MATPFNLHTNITERRARERADKLRAEGKFIEARLGEPLAPGARVLTDAMATDLLAEDQAFRPKPDNNS
jgi:hypothetical protein